MIEKDGRDDQQQGDSAGAAQEPAPRKEIGRTSYRNRPRDGLPSYFACARSNASCTICSARFPSSFAMMQLILISLVVIF